MRHSLLLVAATLVSTSCGTPESNAWGLPRDDVREIGRLIRAQTSAPITGYTRDQKDPRVIDIWVTEDDGYPGLWQAHRVGNHWKVEHRVIVL
jgi:hypothetical protein